MGPGNRFSSFGPGLDHYPAIPYWLIGIDIERPTLDKRIADRYIAQMEAGFLQEVSGLRETTAGLGRTASQALGYRELGAHLDGEFSLEEAIDLAATRTRRFARRQQRWFRRDPRIEWFSHTDDASEIVNQLGVPTQAGRMNL